MSELNQKMPEIPADCRGYDIMSLKPHQCPRCGARYNTYHGMVSHVGKTHGLESMRQKTVNLPTALHEWIDLQVDAGIHANPSECIRFCINHVRLNQLRGEQ